MESYPPPILQFCVNDTKHQEKTSKHWSHCKVAFYLAQYYFLERSSWTKVQAFQTNVCWNQRRYKDGLSLKLRICLYDASQQKCWWPVLVLLTLHPSIFWLEALIPNVHWQRVDLGQVAYRSFLLCSSRCRALSGRLWHHLLHYLVWINHHGCRKY